MKTVLQLNIYIYIYIRFLVATHNTTADFPHLNLFVAAGEFPLLKDDNMMSDPLEYNGDQLIVFLPAQFQFLQPRQRTNISERNRRALFLLC